MPLLARRAASATERTWVYFRMNMYMRPPCVSVPAPRHQSISGRCWTRAYFRDGSIATFRPSAGDFRFTPINGHRETGPAGPVHAISGSERTHSITSSAVARSVSSQSYRLGRRRRRALRFRIDTLRRGAPCHVSAPARCGRRRRRLPASMWSRSLASAENRWTPDCQLIPF
jgi:hypothetical protein